VAKLNLENQFGEISENVTYGTGVGGDQSFVDGLPAKTGVAAIAALAGGADLPTTVAKVNAILAALKVIV
jgi:hypothetical protein